MGSGLSMASVNKIKELANAREYSLALDILDSQDLSRSLNPQFLRLCGEIYTYNHRYRDARHVLLMAHRLAPEAKRVIYSLVYLYLKLGYWKLAKQYYDIYMSDADENVSETKQLMYIYDKAMKKDIDELEPYIAPTYSHTMDYNWTYETILVYMMQGRSKEAEVLAQVYGATFKNTENSLNIQDILDRKREAKSLFDIFADSEAEDDDPKQELDREEECKLLAADELRIHPKEAEIMIMVDDNDDDEIVPKRKLKKLLQEQERREQERLAQEAHDDSAAESEQIEESEKNADSEEKKGKKVFLKSIFPKKKKRDEAAENTDADSSEETEQDNHKNKEDDIETAETAKSSEKKEMSETAETVEPEDTAEAVKADEMQDAAEAVKADEMQDAAEAVKADEMQDTAKDAEAERDAEEAAYREARKIFFGELENRDVEENVDSAVEEKQENEETDMREIHIKERNSIGNSIVSVDMGEDDFTAESDTIEDIRDNAAFSNPFDSLIATKTDDSVPEYKVKKSISFETAELAENDETDEYEVDDFSSGEDDEFGEMTTFKTESVSYDEVESEPDFEGPEQEPDAEIYEENEPEPEVEVYEEPEPEVEVYEEPEPEPEIAEEIEEEIFEPEPEIHEETEPEPEVEVYEETEPEPEPEIEEAGACEEPEIEPEIEEEIEEEISEPEIHEEIEPESEPEIEVYEETEPEPEPEIEETGAYEEPEAELEPEIEEEIEEEITEPEQLSDDYDMLFREPPKKKLDYPVFRSSLFPDYHNDAADVENNFDEIMQEAQDKIQENILKEEQMLREAESLLASLGIELGDIVATSDSYDNMSETLYDGPSRDELKASLKIDSAKRDILRKLKEYR